VLIVFRVVPDFGFRKSGICPFFGNLAKSGSGQGHSDGWGIWVYIPPKSVQVDFLLGKNYVKMAIEDEY